MKKYQIGIYEKAVPEQNSLPQILALAYKAEYDFLEISIDRSDMRIQRLYDDSYADFLKKAVNKEKLPIHSICLSALSTYTLGNKNPEIVQRGVDILYRALLFAERLGCRMIQIPACDVPKTEIGSDETDFRFFDNLKTAVQFASSYGILLALENMENNYMNTVTKCMRAISEINSPYLQLYPDSGNIMSAAIEEASDPLEDMQRGEGHYAAFHLKETAPKKFGGLFYGEGQVDFSRLVKTAWRLGTRRFVMEYWYTGSPEWEADLIKARNFCLDCLRIDKI